MPTTTAATKRFHLRMPIGLGERATAKVAFAKTIEIQASARPPAAVYWGVGDIGGEGDSDPGVSGTRADGTTISLDGVVLAIGRVLRASFSGMPGVPLLKTSHGNLGVLASVQPGEPATGSVVQVLSPSVDAVDAVAVET